ncbi:hypothetical protein AAE478_005102 [Parahypoxylon ruwenzoriense]
MATDAAFTYGSPLQGRSIRLINIKLGSEKTTLEINLIEQSLDEAKFEALSYCNGQSIHVGSNLLDVLCERARRRLTGFVWADAICINQNDDKEKTRQVRMMRDIYSKAKRVVIWIGKQLTDYNTRGYELAKNLYQKLDGDNYDMNASTYDFHDFDCKSQGVPDPLQNQIWAGLFDILRHPWFTRIWVVQELLVAQRSIMWRGALDLETNIILWVTMQIARHRNLYANFNNFVVSPPHSTLLARNVATGYFEYKKTGPLSIYDTLSRYSGMEATDPQDRYFALAGISANLHPSFINYKKSYDEIACLVGKMALLGYPKFLIIPGGVEGLAFIRPPKAHIFWIEWMAFHANPQNEALCLPSWVPDLISPHSPGLLMPGFYNTQYMQRDGKIPLPELRLRQGTHIYWSGSSLPPQVMPIPEVGRITIEITGEVLTKEIGD